MRQTTPLIVLAALAVVASRPTTARAGQDCDEIYDAGPDDPAAFPTALMCYEARGDFGPLILMHLNGDGTPVSVAKAEELLAAWRKAGDGGADSIQGEAIARAVAERKAAPGKSWPRLDWCKDIAGDTLSLNDCAAREAGRAAAGVERRVAAARAKLPAAAQPALDAVVAAFKAYQDADGAFTYQEYADGTIRNMAAMSQEAFVRERFLELLGQVVEPRALPAATAKDYAVADAELNRVYKAKLADYRQYAKPDQAKAYAELGKKVQRLWIKYRDAWAKLATALYGPGGAERAETLVTASRVRELGNKPVGGG